MPLHAATLLLSIVSGVPSAPVRFVRDKHSYHLRIMTLLGILPWLCMVARMPLVNSFTRSEPSLAKGFLTKGLVPPLVGGTTSARDHRCEVLEEGLVVLRGFVSDPDAQRLARAARSMGADDDGDDGFYTTDPRTGQRMLNTGEDRGRIYDQASRFPPQALEVCRDAVGRARGRDPAMPGMVCTHVLLNMYTTSDGICWHRDIYGRSDHPVVNLCLGASCEFAFKHHEDDPERSVILHNGDVLLFGGPCRFLLHSVLKVHLEDCPEWMQDDPYRLSFTFRDSPEVCGRENEFKYFRIQDDLVGQEDFRAPAPAMNGP